MDPKGVYSALAHIYERSGKIQNADEVHDVSWEDVLQRLGCCGGVVFFSSRFFPLFSLFPLA